MWKFQTGGHVESSPAVVDNRVYVGSDDNNVYCLDARDNVVDRKIWSFKTDGRVQSSPAVAGNKVFVASWDGYLYALDAENGSLVWKHEIGQVAKASPAVAYGKVFIGSIDGKFYCFGSWGEVVGPSISTGVEYMLIAIFFFLIVWFLHRKMSD
jgi:glucose dehydrogenase